MTTPKCVLGFAGTFSGKDTNGGLEGFLLEDELFSKNQRGEKSEKRKREGRRVGEGKKAERSSGKRSAVIYSCVIPSVDSGCTVPMPCGGLYASFSLTDWPCVTAQSFMLSNGSDPTLINSAVYLAVLNRAVQMYCAATCRILCYYMIISHFGLVYLVYMYACIVCQAVLKRLCSNKA